MIRLLILRHNFWWWCEGKAGRLWSAFAGDRATYWLDWLPAFCLRNRYRAQNAINRRGYTVYGKKIESANDLERGRRRTESLRRTTENVRQAQQIIESLTRPPDYYI